jgi:drug/metabolite transporter (DMT)-like permease
MKIDIRRLERGTRLVAMAWLAAVGAFLVTSPWHPQVGDSHSGLMAVFPGVLLLLFALVIYAVGRVLSRRGDWGLRLQIVVSVVVVVTVAILALE